MLTSYDKWKLATPEESELCPKCDTILVEQGNLDEYYLECPECEADMVAEKFDDTATFAYTLHLGRMVKVVLIDSPSPGYHEVRIINTDEYLVRHESDLRNIETSL
jgi:hypothetical protein